MENNQHKNVLLLGGTGTLSTAVLKEALQKEYKIWIMNRGKRKRILPDGVQLIIGDFKNISTWKQQVDSHQFDVVVDFLSRVPSDIERVYPIFKDCCKQYIFISSSCVYQRSNEDFPIKESSPKPNRDWNYSIEKYESESMLIHLSEKAHSFYTIIRPYITYDNERIPFGIAPVYTYHRTIIERIKSGKPMFVWNGGRSLTTLTYVDDFAKGVLGLFLNIKAKNEAFHITNDCAYTWIRFWEVLYEKLKMPLNLVDLSCEEIIKKMPDEKGLLLGDRALDAVFDNRKIKEAVPGLDVSVSLERGAELILEHYQNLPSFDYDYRYDALLDRMLSRYTSKTGYVKYPNACILSRIKYFMYRHFPAKYSDKICRFLKIT